MRPLVFACFLVMAASVRVLAQASGVHLDITAERKLHDDAGKKSYGVEMAHAGEDCVYNIIVSNPSLKDSPALDVQYVIFVQRQRLGEKTSMEHLDKVRGSGSIPAIKSQAKGSVATKSFVLGKANLQNGYIYSNGGRQSAKDTVKGIWVRVFDGPTMLAEYANPSTIKEHETWDK